MQKLELPEPSREEQQHSDRLVELIKGEIEQSGGWIDFARFMELALYAPGLGYYSAGQQKFGEQGDFITAPEISPLFSQTLANPVADILIAMQGGDVMEFGAGSGAMAAECLAALQRKNVLPDRYLIVELSAELRERQKQIIMARVPDLIERVQWLDALPEQKIKAVVLANEVLDAMPVQRFVRNQEAVQCLGVALQDDKLVLKSVESDAQLKARVEAIEKNIGREFCQAYSSEINFNAQPWLQSIADTLDQGAVYLIDYGYPQSEYYLPDRIMGTLMCYYQHRAHDNTLWYPGLQDITSFVDFTLVAEAAVDAGFEVEGFTSQANFLIDCGLPQLVEELMSTDIKQQIQLVQQMKTLTLPSEMGERFKVLGLTKHLHMDIPGFGLRNNVLKLS
ncbi:MAG: SAM-dependent methyltransferase [Gammaproteobacteria bacterium]|nr:SAM-dependent methyltransferase [Gammaproteobacteria bacterium]MCW8911106.1 SAM-dependent methyltransferase [Gammaproteobacteria bacterium]MCW9055471.1 SAM-dependent methyltransferase [Gammaproteobacteria bacterium]